MRLKKRKFLVVGLGPAGGILAAHLAAAGHPVCGVDIWEEHIDEIEKNGLAIEHLTTLHSRLWEVSTRPDGIPGDDYHYVVIAVKTPNLSRVVPGLRDMGGGFRVVVLQNGIDNEDYVAGFFEKERILRVALNYAGNIVSPGSIRMNFFQGPNQVGCICGQRGCSHADEMAALMSDAGLDTEAAADIKTFTWKKTILNAILAPIAALLGVTMAEVMADRGTRQIVEALTKESIEVARAAGYDYGEGFFDRCVNFLLKAGNHKPSMLIDLENGQPTEIDYINGKIVSYGNRLNIPVPYNTTMTALVKAREQYNRKGKWYMYRDVFLRKESAPGTAAL